MKKIRFAAILSLFAVVVSFPGCGGESQNANQRTDAASAKTAENPNATKTNAEELGLLINLPYDTEDIAWKGGAAQKKITAVLRFSNEDTAKIVAESQKAGPGEQISLPLETWFPEELTAQSDMSGDSALKGTSFPANVFFQEPFTSGNVIHVNDSNYFVLQLTAK